MRKETDSKFRFFQTE